ncbi:MAG TPA: Glu/Leu/Phe/Val dehydrogenase dimerization domain-containing protein [Acidimicrobiales bacterium]|jgi:leucine dehydrogenase|nr:Glu/Leu/Phe/Val dehydrogenase dimerization domain-containing protein [Acidimicrobiales bacterium]
MEKLLNEWDGEFIVSRREPKTGALLIVAVHSTRRGPSSGGTRAMTYPSLEEAAADAARLGRAMTYKMVMAGLPMGGGKSVIALPQPRAEMAEDDWGRILDLHASTLNTLHGAYWTGPDVNTSSEDMGRLRRTTRYAFGAPAAFGGSGSSAPATATGVYLGMKATIEAAGLGSDLEGRTVLVQGVGAVGHRLAESCLQDGASVLVSDVDAERVARLVAKGAVALDQADVPVVGCDVYAPCAMGGTITMEVAEKLRCRAVAGAANNPLAQAAAADILASRGILYAPDYVINAGGAVHLIGHEVLGWSDEVVAEHLGRIGETLAEVFSRAAGGSTEVAAHQLAVERFGASALAA